MYKRVFFYVICGVRVPFNHWIVPILIDVRSDWSSARVMIVVYPKSYNLRRIPFDVSNLGRCFILLLMAFKNSQKLIFLGFWRGIAPLLLQIRALIQKLLYKLVINPRQTRFEIDNAFNNNLSWTIKIQNFHGSFLPQSGISLLTHSPLPQFSFQWWNY